MSLKDYNFLLASLMSENTVSSNLQEDVPNAMILAQSVNHDSQAQWGIMPNNLQYSDVQYYNFMNLFDLQDLISPSSEEESAQNTWSPRGHVYMEKYRIKNVQYSTSTPWFADDYRVIDLKPFSACMMDIGI